jgi:glycosyltransferase involved in cell wall biosynthesis
MIKSIPASRVLLISRRWTQRGLRSDIDHFFNLFPGARKVSTSNRFKRPYSLLKKIGMMANQQSYNSYSAGIEFRAIWEMLIHRPRVVHFWYAEHEYHYSWLMAKLIGAKLVGNCFFSIEELERRMPDKRHLRHLDLVTASGKKQMAYLESFIEPSKLAYLPLGIDTGFFSPPSQPRWRTRQPPVLLHVGNNRRDIPTLKKVFLKLKASFPDLQLQLVGGDFARPYFHGLPDVQFHPFLSDAQLLKVYHRASLLILPLLEGASSQSLNEAMATGLPVITNQLPNLEDYVVFPAVQQSPVGDANAMAAQSLKLLREPDFAEQASSTARRHALQFDFSRIGDTLHSLYESKLNYRILSSRGKT